MIIPDDLYKKILPVMPIPCVDLVVVDQTKRILLLKRRNDPAKGQWWVPGGRIHMGETRVAAAVRKLREECGLIVGHQMPIEISTEDLMLPTDQGGLSHTITMIYRIDVGNDSVVVLDGQSDAFDWRTREAWLATDIHSYVKTIIDRKHKSVG